MALDFNDKTVNGNNLTNNNATEWTTNFPFAQSTEAVALSGSSQYLYAADSATLSITGDLTIEGWVRLDTVNQSINFVAKRNAGTNNRSYGIGFSDNTTGSQLSFYGSSNGTLNDGNIITTGSGIEDTNWHHIAVTYDASEHTIQFYVDGIAFEAAKDCTITSIYDGNASVDIGSQEDGRVSTLDGKVDEIRIWNDVRSAAEILANKSKELAGTEANLVAYWPFESTLNTTTTTSTSTSTSSTSTSTSTSTTTRTTLTSSSTTSSSTSTSTSTSSSSSTSSSTSSTTTAVLFNIGDLIPEIIIMEEI